MDIEAEIYVFTHTQECYKKSPNRNHNEYSKDMWVKKNIPQLNIMRQRAYKDAVELILSW